jgi:hypothetical protein
LLIVAALMLGFTFDYLQTDGVLKPAIVLVIYAWLTWLMAVPARWREIVEGREAARVSTSEQAIAGTPAGVATHR